ncbi:MAG: RNA polymerase sigma factor [Candidatus Aminicenantes bacterium]|nr:RNA polymerase sigma factor [Candidatus Aminicenantes bacterium]
MRMTLDEIYDAYGDALYRYLTLKLGSVQDAEDILQDVFVRLARSIDRRRLLSDPKAFVFRCAHNEAGRFWKRRLGRRDRESAFRPDLASAIWQGPDGPSEIRLGEALAGLSAEQREAVVLKEYEGLTFRAIGSACGIPTHTAASRYRYGMARLREFFGEKR